MKYAFPFAAALAALMLFAGCSVNPSTVQAAATSPASSAPVAAVAAAATTVTAAADPSAAMTELQNGFVRLTEQIRPFVVNINTEGSAPGQEIDPRQFNDLFRFFGMPFGPQGGPNMQVPKQMRMAQGSGFIFDNEGHIITNNHMVEGADKITVKLATGKEYPAKVVGRDPDTDLAVIKIEPDGDLPAAALGDSDKLKTGEFLIACGSPRGFEGSFSFGHVSALGRNQINLPGLRFENFIQTDAAINPGNSGGPLCDIQGQVVGINVAIVYGANALGFAIPINTAKQIIPTLISKGKVTRGFLGVGVMSVDPFSDALGLPDKKGAFVKTVQSGSPAEQAGIKPYDVIRKVNGAAVENAAGLVQLVSNIAPGNAAKLEIWRDKKATEVDVKVGQFPTSAASPEAPSQETLGLHVDNLTPDLAGRLQLKSGTSGVVITGVNPTSAAAEAGLNEGDVITEIAQQKVNNTDDFSKLMKEHAVPGKSVLIGFIRNGDHDITVVKVPK